MSLVPAQMIELADRIAELVVERSADCPALVDRQGLAKTLGVSVATVERLQKDGLIPCVRIRERVLYDPVEVIARLKQQSEEASRNFGLAGGVS